MSEKKQLALLMALSHATPRTVASHLDALGIDSDDCDPIPGPAIRKALQGVIEKQGASLGAALSELEFFDEEVRFLLQVGDGYVDLAANYLKAIVGGR
jgi:hypothetical protein